MARVVRVIRNGGGKPNIGQMVQFITEKAMAANDPVFGDIMDNKDSTKNEKPRQKFRPAARVTSKANTYAAQTEKTKLPENLNVNTTNSKPSRTQAIKCWLCEGAHMLSSCHQFERKNQEERLKITRIKDFAITALNEVTKPKSVIKRDIVHTKDAQANTIHYCIQRQILQRTMTLLIEDQRTTWKTTHQRITHSVMWCL